jgi:hypothetical protein
LQPDDAPAARSAPLDADDTRGMHFRRIAGHGVTLSLTATLAIAAFVAATLAAGVAIGAGAGAAVLLLALLIVFVIASNAAKEDFFGAYASARGLQRSPGGGLPPATPLLRKGDRRYAEQIMSGDLPGGVAGTVCLYTYEERHSDSEGREDVDPYRFTVAAFDVPAAAARIADLYCQRRSGFRFMDSTEDAFRRMQRLELESDRLDRRYEIFYGVKDDQNWARQLFEPSFIIWLSDSAPEDFAFEFSAGALVVSTKGHRDDADGLDAICEAACRVARRFGEEATE